MEQLPEELGARRSVCSGTLMGIARGLMVLTRQMNEATRDLPACRAGPLDQVMTVHDLPWPTTDLPLTVHDLPLDQALLNLIVHRQLSQPELVLNLASVSTRLELQGDGGSMNTVALSAAPCPYTDGVGSGRSSGRGRTSSR